MNKVDFLLLAMTITTTLHTMVLLRHNKRARSPLVVLLVVLAFVQFEWQGYYWHYVPTYLLIAFLILITWVKKTSTPFYRILQQMSLGLLLLVSLIPWTLFLPIPTLTKPPGSYAVGTQVFRWIDFDRAEQTTKDPFDKRNVIVQAWYPAAPKATGSHSLYLDGLHHVLEQREGPTYQEAIHNNLSFYLTLPGVLRKRPCVNYLPKF